MAILNTKYTNYMFLFTRLLKLLYYKIIIYTVDTWCIRLQFTTFSIYQAFNCSLKNRVHVLNNVNQDSIYCAFRYIVQPWFTPPLLNLPKTPFYGSQFLSPFLSLDKWSQIIKLQIYHKPGLTAGFPSSKYHGKSGFYCTMQFSFPPTGMVNRGFTVYTVKPRFTFCYTPIYAYGKPPFTISFSFPKIHFILL